MMRSLMLILALFCAPLMADVATSKQQYANYVILGQSPAGKNVAIARTVIEPALTCPSVSATGKKMRSINMTTRENPNHFAVIVCEAVIGFDLQYQLNFADKSIKLPIAKSDIEHIAVFGDTGCKSSVCQLGKAAQPFKDLANSGAKSKPDVVLHMGDYNYRGTGGQIDFATKAGQQAQWPYDAGDSLTNADHCGQLPTMPYYSQSDTKSNHPDIWQYWYDDLFKSAKKLMAAAPWVVSRGNHELCSRAGPGYFYFLDPHSNLIPGQQQLSCPTPDINKTVIQNTLQIPNYVVQFKQLDIAVLDSANACDGFIDTPYTALYTNVFSYLATQVKGDKPTWLISHRPIWAAEDYDGDKSTGCTANNTFGCINQMMQQAIKNQPSGALPENIKLILTGHMHKFESVSFGPNANRPANIIVGSSGVSLSGDQPNPSAKIAIDGMTADVLTTNTQITSNGKTYDSFSYLDIQLGDNGAWQGNLINPTEKLIIAKCSSKQNLANGVCELAEGITVVNK